VVDDETVCYVGAQLGNLSAVERLSAHESRVVSQDPLLEVAQLRCRLQSRGFDEAASVLPVHGKGVGVAAAAVQRDHQTGAQPLRARGAQASALRVCRSR